MKCVCVGDRLAAGGYRLHSRFAGAVNYEGAGGALLCAVSPQAGPGPINIVFENFAPQQLAQRLEFSPAGIKSGGLSFPLDGVSVYDSALSPPAGAARGAVKNAPRYGRLLARAAPELSFARLLDGDCAAPDGGFARELFGAARRGMELLRAGRFSEGARRLKGLGVGLTPSGDDFLCGFLLGVNVLEKARGKNFNNIKQPVFAAALGGGALSRAFLECARAGRAGWRIKGLFESLADPAARAAAPALRDALSHGATSGADTAAGFIFALEGCYGD